MSKIGKKPISIPDGVTIGTENHEVVVRGPKGELRRAYATDFSLAVEGKILRVVPFAPEKKHVYARWGSLRAHVANMIKGVSEGFERKLEFEGIGYRAEADGKELVLSVGFTHPVRLGIPEGLAVAVAKNVISIIGIDKEKVGAFAAAARSVRPPEPYKATGIRYAGEIVRKKAGKKLAGAAGTAQ